VRSRKPHTPWRRLALAAALCTAIAAAAFWASLPSADALRRTNPSSTALIDARAREARRKNRPARRNQHWAALKNISPWLKDAVVNSEDARFYEHDGVDAVQVRVALARAAEGGRARGASTLTQQLAKNLWLGEERSLTRKLKELVLARRLETLGKDRVLELYLNIAEWGDGIYGADAAARVWFHKPAAELRAEEAAILAAMLPSPRKRNPRKPNTRLRQRATEILELFGTYKQLSPAELALARERLRSMLGA
jgi:monofunctional biosynthetic peptidoglycan transglycosylase